MFSKDYIYWLNNSKNQSRSAKCCHDSFLFRPLPVYPQNSLPGIQFTCGYGRVHNGALNTDRPDMGEFPEVTLSDEALQNKWKEDGIRTANNYRS